MTKQWKVYGRVRADYEFEEIVEAATQKGALKMAEKKVYKHLGIDNSTVIDEEIYCEKIKEWGAK